MEKKKRGRPMSSADVKVTPEFRDNPDLEKLGRALIAVAISIAQKKAAEENAAKEGSQGDNPHDLIAPPMGMDIYSPINSAWSGGGSDRQRAVRRSGTHK